MKPKRMKPSNTQELLMLPRAEVFPVGVFLADELSARGWTIRDLAERMGGDADIIELALELLVRTPNPKMILDDQTARGLAAALGTSKELWLRLDKTWRDSQP